MVASSTCFAHTFVSLKEVTAYACSKAAVGALTKSLAVEWSAQGVRSTPIAPRLSHGAEWPSCSTRAERGRSFASVLRMGGFRQTEELVGSAIFLASDASAFVTGENPRVHGGFLAAASNQ